MGKGGSKQVATDTTQRTTNLPEYADPYFRRMLQGAEEALMPFQTVEDLSSPIYDDAGNITGFETRQETTYKPYPGERIAPSSMYGDIQASRAMTRGIAQSGISGMPEAQGAAQAAMGIQSDALGGLRGLANYQTGDFSAYEPTSMRGTFQAADTGSFADEFSAFQPTSMVDQFQQVDPTRYSGFREAKFDPYSNFRMANYNQFRFQQPEQFSSRYAQQYMSPYMDAVVAEQKRGAIQDFERSQAGRDAAAVQAGAFGGSRQAVGQYLAEEGLGEQLGGIEAMGRQQAFEQAAQQFGLDRAARMEAEARQAAELGRVQAGRAGELGRVQTSEAGELARIQAGRAGEMGRVQGAEAAEQARIDDFLRMEANRVQAARAAEQARLDALGASELGRVQAGRVGELGRAQGLTASELARIQAAEAGEQGRLDALGASELGRIQQAIERSRQFGAGQGLAAYQAIGAGASNLAGLGAGLAGLGERQRAADIQGAQLLETIGRDIRAEDQARLDLAYEDFLRQRDYPITQYERMAGILRGVPVTPNVEQQRFASYNPIQQALGAGISALGLYKGLSA